MTSLFYGPVIHLSQNAGVGNGRAPSHGFQTQLMLECSDQEVEIPLLCNFQLFDCSKDGRNLTTQLLEVFYVCVKDHGCLCLHFCSGMQRRSSAVRNPDSQCKTQKPRKRCRWKKSPLRT